MRSRETTILLLFEQEVGMESTNNSRVAMPFDAYGI